MNRQMYNYFASISFMWGTLFFFFGDSYLRNQMGCLLNNEGKIEGKEEGTVEDKAKKGRRLHTHVAFSILYFIILLIL